MFQNPRTLACKMRYIGLIVCVIAICIAIIAQKFDAETPVEENTPPSYPEASSPTHDTKFDVFISFNGKDIREGLLSHLTKALRQKQIFTFVDTKLEQGGEISQELLQAIEKSLISLVVFSENYAFSTWCLDELVKIMECRREKGQIVLPVFYRVEPSHVRHQKGVFSTAFAKQEKRFGKEKAQTWRSVFQEAANISGFHSAKFGNDAELIEEIIQSVNTRLKNMRQFSSKGLFGIAKSISRVESLLRQEPESVRVIGIWGMGGFGKTTVAEVVYNLLRDEYESVVFLRNVREVSLRHGIIYLKNELFSKLLGENLEIDTQNGLPTYVEKRIGRMKVLIVLDDVNQSEQFEILVGTPQSFGSGSRIIVTTRDRQVLAKYAHANDTYKVEPLESDEALQLFNLIAFQQNEVVEKEYSVLAERVVDHAKGIPLVLKTLGHLLHGKEKWIWESELEKLGKIPNKKVFDMMRLSYDELDRQEKSMLLDIACFFDGMKLKVKYLESLLKHGDFPVPAALKRLEDISFITISKEDVVTMHDIVQEMAWEIVRQESIEDPGNYSRIWNPEDIYQVLKNNQGSEAIRSINFSYSKATVRNMQLSPQVFSKMSKLRFLDFYGEQHLLHFPEGLQQLPSRLRYLRWTYYPLKSLPKKFSAEKLVILELPYSQVEKLWYGIQNLVNLKVLKAPYSSQLKEFPDLSKATNLEILDFKYCLRLTRVHPSVFSLNKLETLDLSWCSQLARLETNAHLKSLRYLSLYHCKRLNKFSVISENMTELDLRHTSIRELPSSFGCQSKLEKLHLANSEVKKMPESMKLLTSLKYLDISDCKNLQTLPELPLSIETLDADNCTSLKAVLFPNASEQLKENKKKAVFWNCLKLENQFLNAVVLNAYINMVRFSNQYLSAIEHDNVDNSNEDPEASYVYPGSKVPEWLEYRTNMDHLTVNLSSAPYAPKLGFILCFIVPAVPSEGFRLMFTISGDDQEEDDVNEVRLYVDRPRKEISWDHVILIYDQRCSSFLNNRGQNRRMFNIKVSVVSLSMTSEYVAVELKGFGVHPVNPLEYPSFISFIKRMEQLGYYTTPATVNPDSLWNGIRSWFGAHNWG
ncbi:disease resistance protein RPV1-like [Arachis stenosperma]|uniref:disease resistance protein RPV1-like n=1 Tax=Arachis stenosperma TaxID=217475 RepID=UPI0025AB6A03|nr:disease resistance protein RPV1-like [Arachis stenosperma]